MPSRVCQAIKGLREGMGDVDRLLEIHEDISGTDRGRRYGVEVLNKSCVVLITACWEAFVEDLAAEAFDTLLTQATAPGVVPAKVRAMAAKPLRDAEDAVEVWQLAGDGWRQILQQHRAALLAKHIGTFNTPKPGNIDALFEGMIGLRHLTSVWHWQGVSAQQASDKLEGYIRTRGSIAHRSATAETITKAYAQGYRRLVYRLAVKSSNHVRSYLHGVTGEYPWASHRFGQTR